MLQITNWSATEKYDLLRSLWLLQQTINKQDVSFVLFF